MSTALVESPQTYEQERGKPKPSENHGIVQMNLGIELAKHRDYRIVSELSLELNGRPFTPDLCVYPRQPVDFRYDTIRRTDPPLVAVEISSPTQGYQDVMEKVKAYFQNGVKTCWVVNTPQRAITVYAADGSFKTFAEGQVKDACTGLLADLDAVFS